MAIPGRFLRLDAIFRGRAAQKGDVESTTYVLPSQIARFRKNEVKQVRLLVISYLHGVYLDRRRLSMFVTSSKPLSFSLGDDQDICRRSHRSC